MSKRTTKPALVCRVDKGVLPRGEKATRVLELAISTPVESKRETKPPLNLGIVIDRSGSMQGEKLHYAKQAAAHLVDLLGEKDRAAVVVYDNTVDVVAPLQAMDAANKTSAKTAIQKVFSRGSTALYDGWLQGCKQVAEMDLEGLSRTLLLSDGLANVGLTDLDEIASQARELFERGVSTSCFGIGTGYNEHLLEAMSNAGGGSFHFLEALSAIPLAFEREFEELMSIAYQDAALTLELPGDMHAEVSAGWPSVKNGDTLVVSLGNLYAGREQALYIQLHHKAVEDQTEVEIPVALTAKDMDEKSVEIKQVVDFKVVDAAQAEKTESDAELLARFALVDMADRATEALKRARSGDRAGAERYLQGSMAHHNKYMSPAMRNKYQYMSREISEGMNEMSLKRHHQEEYTNKRTRMDLRDYHLRTINRHLFTTIDNQMVLIDTGIPVTIGRLQEWYFMQRVFPLSEGYLGVTPEQISRLVGKPVDILLGMDILKNYSVLFELSRQRIGFSPRALLRSRHKFPMSMIMGVPGVGVDIDGSPTEVYVDTGAKLSYVASEFVQGMTPVDRESDFYPEFGEFETDVYNVDFSLGDQVFTLRCGVLPSMLETALKVTGKKGIIGVDFFRRYTVQLNFPNQVLSLRA